MGKWDFIIFLKTLSPAKGSQGQVTQISTNQLYKCQKHSRIGSCAKPMNPKGKILGKVV